MEITANTKSEPEEKVFEARLKRLEVAIDFLMKARVEDLKTNIKRMAGKNV